MINFQHPPFNKGFYESLTKMIKETALGGEESTNTHLKATDSDCSDLSHIVMAICWDDAVIGWCSSGLQFEFSETESVVRSYLDFIYISPDYRHKGAASLAINEITGFLIKNMVLQLPDIGSDVLPLDVELSATFINPTGESCVNQFWHNFLSFAESELADSSFVLREFINESKTGYK